MWHIFFIRLVSNRLNTMNITHKYCHRKIHHGRLVKSIFLVMKQVKRGLKETMVEGTNY